MLMVRGANSNCGLKVRAAEQLLSHRMTGVAAAVIRLRGVSVRIGFSPCSAFDRSAQLRGADLFPRHRLIPRNLLILRWSGMQRMAGFSSFTRECPSLLRMQNQTSSPSFVRATALSRFLRSCYDKPVARFPVISYWRFMGGSDRIRIISGHLGQSVQHMQIVQSRINTADFASR